MFKNFVYEVWLVIGLIVLLIIGFVVNDLQKAEQLNSENKAELKAYGVKTEALTYDYGYDYGWTGRRSRLSSKSKKRAVFYVYFADSQKYQFSKVLDQNDSRFDTLNKHVHPLVWKLIYSKKNPRINELILDAPLDSITDSDLQNFVVEYYHLPNIDKFYKIFNEKPIKNVGNRLKITE